MASGSAIKVETCITEIYNLLYSFAPKARKNHLMVKFTSRLKKCIVFIRSETLWAGAPFNLLLTNSVNSANSSFSASVKFSVFEQIADLIDVALIVAGTLVCFDKSGIKQSL